MPRLANACHSCFWLAPLKRIRSAARYASRAPSIETSGGMSRKASYTIWIQRLLPGHRFACLLPSAQAAWIVVFEAGYEPLYLLTSAARMSKLTAFQISPSAWTSLCESQYGSTGGPTSVVLHAES